jgi:hypothetical protein
LELLEWYYSLVFESEESHAIAEVANTALEIANPPGRRSVSGRPTHQDLVDRSWSAYDRIVDDAVDTVVPFRGTYAPHVGAGQGIAGIVAWFMKAGMQFTGIDDALVRKKMPRRMPRYKND